MKRLIVIFIFLCTLIVKGQTNSSGCDTIYQVVDTMPEYDNGIEGLMDYLRKDLTPILSRYSKKDKILATSMHLTLTIDNSGRVIDVDFERLEASEECKKTLREKILTMPDWKPGHLNGQPVCCEHVWPVKCMLWK